MVRSVLGCCFVVLPKLISAFGKKRSQHCDYGASRGPRTTQVTTIYLSTQKQKDNASY